MPLPGRPLLYCHWITSGWLGSRPAQPASGTLIPPSVQDIILSTTQATALARQVISSMNAHMSQTVNAYRRPVDFSVGQLVLLSTQNIRLPGGSLHTKKFSNK
jgi:hypothetical protein